VNIKLRVFLKLMVWVKHVIKAITVTKTLNMELVMFKKSSS